LHGRDGGSRDGPSCGTALRAGALSFAHSSSPDISSMLVIRVHCSVVPSLPGAISVVVPQRADEKVVGVYALWCIALVADKHPVRDLPNVGGIEHSMRAKLFPSFATRGCSIAVFWVPIAVINPASGLRHRPVTVQYVLTAH